MVTVDTPSSASGVEPVLSAGPSRAARQKRAVRGLAWLVIGTGVIVVGTLVLGSQSGAARVGLALAGALAIFVAVGQLGKAWRGEHFDATLWLSVAWLVIVVAAAAFAGLLPLAEARDASETLTEPALARPDLLSEHPLGTGRQGLDILGGVIYGARVSLTVGLGAVAIGMVVGSLFGVAAGYYRGTTERLIDLLANSMLAFPPLIFLLALAAVLEPNVRNVTFALAVLGVPLYIRLARANTLVFAQREFVLAARSLGASDRRIIFREVVPNVALPVVSFGFITIAVLIVAEASLSFLGLSIQRPNPTWGNMIAAGQADLRTDPHLVFAPGVALFLTVFAFNRIGDWARALWDPRASQVGS